jgi:hypothetical protein
MSSTAWLTRRSVSLGLSEHSPARSHRSDGPTTRDVVRCSAPDHRDVAYHYANLASIDGFPAPRGESLRLGSEGA